jgi:pyridoxal phosphate enzyme (YggS family)
MDSLKDGEDKAHSGLLWFLWGLQSIHGAAAAGVPNLYMVEGVDSLKVANHLDRAVSGVGRQPLRVLVQVNTSGEDSKSGVEPSECVHLAKHVKQDCPNLLFSGLMTIGMRDYTSTPENFQTLANCRKEVCKELDIPEHECELSMGMSGDFELAVLFFISIYLLLSTSSGLI